MHRFRKYLLHYISYICSRSWFNKLVTLLNILGDDNRLQFLVCEFLGIAASPTYVQMSISVSRSVQVSGEYFLIKRTKRRSASQRIIQSFVWRETISFCRTTCSLCVLHNLNNVMRAIRRVQNVAVRIRVASEDRRRRRGDITWAGTTAGARTTSASGACAASTPRPTARPSTAFGIHRRLILKLTKSTIPYSTFKHLSLTI